jgi:uncharacterized protein YigA (DUF484 family)
MKRRLYRKVEGELSLRYIAEAECRVKEQEQRITRLKEKGRPTEHAESTLLGFQRTLMALRSHREILQELTKLRPF